MKQILRLLAGAALLVLLSQAVLGSAASAAPATWVTTPVETTGDVGLHTSIALDTTDSPRISYYDQTNGTLRLAGWTGSAWVLEVVDDTEDRVGLYSSLALDVYDRPHIAYARDWVTTWLKYASWSDTGWQIEEVDQEAQGVGRYVSLALDVDGNAHISYVRHWSHQAVKYARWAGSAWDIEIVFKGGSSGGGNSPEYYVRGTSIALTATGSPRIAYRGSGSDAHLDYARPAGRKWSSEIVDPDGDGNGLSLALDAWDNPAISYYDSANRDLRYARWNPATETWDLEIIDSIGDVGSFSSLVLDGSDNPHISYYDMANGDLKYARWSGSAWEIEIVDSDGDVGSYSSLALDGSGNPHISYYDATNGDLKYATVLSQCASDLDCDDSNDCTIDWCDTATATCNHSFVADNQSCDGGAAICCSGSCVTPECSFDAPCDDGEGCTTDTCMLPDTCSAVCDFVWPGCGGPVDQCCPPGCDAGSDPDCPACVPTHSKEKGPRCSDGIDNDCDGLIDGDDPDC